MAPQSKLASAIILITTGIYQVLSVCEAPENLKDVIHFAAVPNPNGTHRYIVSCIDTNPELVLYPLGDYDDLTCENGVWFKSKDFTTPHSLDLDGFKCMYMCSEPDHQNNGDLKIDDDYLLQAASRGRLTVLSQYVTNYIPGFKFVLTCDNGYSPSTSDYTLTCGGDGRWSWPTFTAKCVNRELTTKSAELDSPAVVDQFNSKIIIIIVSISACVITVLIMTTIAVRARWRLVCRKRRATNSHPDDSNYPHGYTQLGSGSMLPSYAEATDPQEDTYRDGSYFGPSVYSVYRPTTTSTSDYRQLSSMESSSRGESESLSAGSHRHSLFSGSSANYRYVGDDISDILLQGDHLSMSDTSTLVTVNTYESNTTASNPSLTNSRRGNAGSANSQAANSMDDAPLIVRGDDEQDDDIAEIPTTQRGIADC